MDKNKIKSLAFPFLFILIGFALISLSIGLFFEISENVVNQEIKVFDNAIIGVFENMSSPTLYRLMIFVTELGSVWFITVVSFSIILYLWFKEKDRWGILFLLISIGGGGLIIAALKNYYQTDRPSINEHIDAIGYSFPSGHAMGSLIIYGFIVYLLLKSNLSKAIKLILSVLLILLIFLISISRVYLSAHFQSDVIAGQAGGIAWLMICIISLEAIKWKTRTNFKPLKSIKNLLEKTYNHFN